MAADISTLDKLILDVALGEVPEPRRVAVLDDPSGALLDSVLAWPSVRTVWVGSRTVDQARAARELLTGEAGNDGGSLAHGVGAMVRVAGLDGSLRLDEFLTEPLDLAIGHVPKSLEEVAYIAGATACTHTGADSESGAPVLVIGANNKHMDRGHNATLANYFTHVRASRGRGKFRALIAGGEPTGRTYAPAVGNTEAGPLFGVGGVFSGAEEDHGARLLVDSALAELRAEALEQEAAVDPWDTWERSAEPAELGLDVVDLGCGNGAVALAMIDALAKARVLATDSHADAVVSAGMTLREFVEAGRARVTWDDAAAAEPDANADVVLLNPPFHTGHAIDATLVHGLLDAARRLLRPGGRLYMVHNNHLRYRPDVEARFGRVEELARNPKFTVLRATRLTANKANAT